MVIIQGTGYLFSVIGHMLIGNQQFFLDIVNSNVNFQFLKVGEVFTKPEKWWTSKNSERW